MPTTDETRALVQAQRDAFVAGAEWRASTDVLKARIVAASRYPLPKVTRPRYVRDPENVNREWKVERGELYTRRYDNGTVDWYPVAAACLRGETVPPPTIARVRLWADLIENPTEEVQDDARDA